jgi:2-aminoadipate transaminase
MNQGRNRRGEGDALSSIINWMGGWPKEGLVSGADWEERVEAAAASLALARDNDPRGTEMLRNQLAQGLLKDKTGGNGNLLTMTNGADGGLATLIEQLLVPGDTVLMEKLTSRSALQAFRKAGVRVETVEGDRRGMDPESLTTALYRYRPRMVYASPTCTDPEGGCWSQDIKQVVQHRCLEAGVLLVTDDRQEMLQFDSEDHRTIRKVEPGTVSIGQLPPGLISGLRIGWIAGAVDSIPAGALGAVTVGGKVASKASGAPAVGALEQVALSRLIAETPLEPLTDMLRIQCRERMKRMTEQLANKQLPDLAWVTPKGGLHLWVILPEGLEGESLLRGAWLKGLIFQPGTPYYVKDPKINTLRITYAFADEREMKQGVSRLAESIEEFTGRWSRS